MLAVSSISINLFFVGTFGNGAMTAAVGLAASCSGILVSSFIVGTNCAQDTLTSQAYGAGELRRCGVLLNRGRVIIVVLFIPFLLIFQYSKEILDMAGFDPQVSVYANEYLTSISIGLFF